MIKPELLIKINADLKDFNSKMDQIKKKSGELSDSLSSIGVIAGVAFAGLTAVTFKTVSAYKEAKEASLKLEQTLKIKMFILRNWLSNINQWQKSYKAWSQLMMMPL